jgi:hypothetical protein
MAVHKGIELYGIEGNFLVHEIFDEEPTNFVMEALI